MKLQFRHQKFQADAAKAVVDVFAGQPYLTSSYQIDIGQGYYQTTLMEETDGTGWANAGIVPELSDQVILEHIQKVQRSGQIELSEKLEGRYNLTIEMETGVGKTYTYIKTMYELNRQYGWTKFIVVVPSIAVREGVYKSFQITQEHFAEEYGKKIRFFIYHSSKLTEIEQFASDSSIHVMIINAQAFNARGKDSRRIYMKLDEFQSRRPIDLIAKTHPIVIIDEPQSVEGKQTKENLKQFHPLMTLRYSATHKADSIYNMIYRLDAMDAYNRHLVKKIAVKGITKTGSTALDSYVYIQSINLSKEAPTATIQFDCRSASGIQRRTRTVGIGFNLYEHSGRDAKLEEYRDGFVIRSIDGRDDSVEFLNGIKLHAGDVMGEVSEEQLRRIQIRETILSHLERERQLFHKGIKVLSLFFLDEVAHYKVYNEAGQAGNGLYAQMFEEEYEDVVRMTEWIKEDRAYQRYLEAIPASAAHAGYFSIDRKGGRERFVNSKITDKKERLSDDISAYDLIMRDKERLLNLDPKRSPVRFLFSHSALREGWDNPNVFQICTLKQSGSDVRKRQEVGRGLRLCVDQEGRRMDVHTLGEQAHSINILTVIASESYDSFAKGLQEEMAEAVAARPQAVTMELFLGKVLTNEKGEEWTVDQDTAAALFYDLTICRYIDKKGMLTEKYYEDRKNHQLRFAEEAGDSTESVMRLLDGIYDQKRMLPENARSSRVELRADPEKLNSQAFRELWSRISQKTAYVVDFDTNELVKRAVKALDQKLQVPKIYFRVESGQLEEVISKKSLVSGESMRRGASSEHGYETVSAGNQNVKYDLVGKLVEETRLTRKAVIQILTGIQEHTFCKFKDNPEEFIIKAAALINEQKAAVIIDHISYKVLDERYGTEVLVFASAKGKLGVNAMKANKHLYDYVVYDSEKERAFAEKLDTVDEVAVYVKLPKGFYISTPAGNYCPDWAIAFSEGTMKHVYFVAETKGSVSSMQLRQIEEAKIHCAREHFKAISGSSVIYDVVESWEGLMESAKA
ncbi:MAG: DEAD/DEAH box helicase family protein [Lachnospiraceae bacterium]|nr:DEAD/DEAH box helicase family protein [Lachnospiraceae bacterium]